MGIDEPLAPIKHGRFGAVASRHLGGVRFRFTAALFAINRTPATAAGVTGVNPDQT
jgi:hypothetical protein